MEMEEFPEPLRQNATIDLEENVSADDERATAGDAKKVCNFLSHFSSILS